MNNNFNYEKVKNVGKRKEKYSESIISTVSDSKISYNKLDVIELSLVNFLRILKMALFNRELL